MEISGYDKKWVYSSNSSSIEDTKIFNIQQGGYKQIHLHPDHNSSGFAIENTP